MAPERERVRAALAAMAHRGPDDEGCWIGDDAALGHRRLSIIDLSADGRQPMSRPDDGIQVVCNGEIYNFIGIREQLRSCGYRFRSGSDTEVLLHGYHAWGIEGLIERVEGMFAFAIWDGPRKTLHLVRDRVGKKPLFFRQDGGTLRFASTLPALLRLDPTTASVDPVAVQDFLQYLCVPGDRSIVQGVSKLLPGHRAEFRDGRLTLHRYWSLSYLAKQDRSYEDWLDTCDEELRRATRARLIADVPIGIFLSGGVDSSLVTALAVAESGGPVRTISARFDDPALDESEHAARVARHLGTDHVELDITAIAPDRLAWLAHVAGEPFADPALLPTAALAEAAREHVRVVLTGDGGDEAFAGYPQALIARVAGPYMSILPLPLRARVPGLLEWVERAGGGRRARMLRRLGAPARSAAWTWEFDPLAERGFRGRWDELLAPGFRERLGARDPDDYWQHAFDEARADDLVDRVLAADIETLLPDMFLVKTDVATMAHGIEARSPLLDHRVLESSAAIPSRLKLKGFQTKRLLKDIASRYVPSEVLFRKKQGFGVPIGRWLRGPLRESCRELLLSERFARREIVRPEAVRSLIDAHFEGRADHGQRLFALMQLEAWHREVLEDRSWATGSAAAAS